MAAAAPRPNRQRQHVTCIVAKPRRSPGPASGCVLLPSVGSAPDTRKRMSPTDSGRPSRWLPQGVPHDGRRSSAVRLRRTLRSYFATRENTRALLPSTSMSARPPRGTTADPCRPSVRGVRSRSQPHPSPTARHVSRMHVIGWPRLGLLLGPAVVRLTGGRMLHLVDKPQTARHFVARDLGAHERVQLGQRRPTTRPACTTAATCWP